MPDTRTRKIRVDIENSASRSTNPHRYRQIRIDIDKSASRSNNPHRDRKIRIDIVNGSLERVL
eukprot:2186966-Heterocapsa_arctica.AAC.1